MEIIKEDVINGSINRVEDGLVFHFDNGVRFSFLWRAVKKYHSNDYDEKNPYCFYSLSLKLKNKEYSFIGSGKVYYNTSNILRNQYVEYIDSMLHSGQYTEACKAAILISKMVENQQLKYYNNLLDEYKKTQTFEELHWKQKFYKKRNKDVVKYFYDEIDEIKFKLNHIKDITEESLLYFDSFKE